MDYVKEIERLGKRQAPAQTLDVLHDHGETFFGDEQNTVAAESSAMAPLSADDARKAKRIISGTMLIGLAFMLWFAWRNIEGVWDGYYLQLFQAMFVLFPLVMAASVLFLWRSMIHRVDHRDPISPDKLNLWRIQATRWSWVIPALMIGSFASVFWFHNGIPIGHFLGRTSPNETTKASKLPNTAATKVNVNTDADYPAVLQATDRNDLVAIAMLKTNQQDVQAPNANGYTALHLAAARGAIPTMQALIDAGALVNAPAPGSKGYGRTPLDSAVFEDKVDAVKLLLANGAKVDAADQGGWLALHYAVHHRASQSLTVLLEAAKLQGVDLNARATGMRGETTLMKAAERNHLDGIRQLIQAGAQMDVLDKHGKNALDYAEFFKQKEASDLLCSLGASPTNLDATAPNNEVSKRNKC